MLLLLGELVQQLSEDDGGGDVRDDDGDVPRVGGGPPRGVHGDVFCGDHGDDHCDVFHDDDVPHDDEDGVGDDLHGDHIGFDTMNFLFRSNHMLCKSIDQSMC